MSEQDSLFLRISQNPVAELTGDKLPRKYEVLQLLVHKNTSHPYNLKDNVKLVIIEIKKIWARGSIPVRRDDKCETKLNELYTSYRDVQKSAQRYRNDGNYPKKNTFENELGNVFDISFNNLSEFKLTDESRRTLLLKPIDVIRDQLIKFRNLPGNT